MKNNLIHFVILRDYALGSRERYPVVVDVALPSSNGIWWAWRSINRFIGIAPGASRPNEPLVASTVDCGVFGFGPIIDVLGDRGYCSDGVT